MERRPAASTGAPPWTGGLLGGDRFTAELERWAADAGVDEAARRRSQERWLRQAAEEDATLAGVLVDLAERRVGVAVHTTAGHRHHGTVAAVGSDFVALRLRDGGHVLLSLDAVTVARTAPEVPATVGDRAVRTELGLAGALAGLAAERERVLLVTRDGGDAVAGELRAVGQDVAVVRTDGDRPASAYVALAAVAEVSSGR